MATSFRWAYAGLWLVRIWFALYGTAYIHPDEHMQNGEITAGNILGVHTSTPWEWRSDMPLRSILPVFATTGLPLLALRILFGRPIPHPSLIFRIQRLSFLCFSGVLDYSVLGLVPSPPSRHLSLLLLASSYVICTFQVRPFSNSLEAILLSVCLVLLRQLLDTRTGLEKIGRQNTNERVSHLTYTLKRDLHLLAVLTVIGIFTRPTFVAFALPIAYQVLRLSHQVAGSPSRAVGLLAPPFCTAMLTISLFITTDTYYFRGDFSRLVITPYNFVKYNLSIKNLAEHGLHPNWLHVGVNLPMLLGPLPVWLIQCSMDGHLKPSQRRDQNVHFETDINTLRRTLIQIIVLSLSALSVQPHQEPRFLTPLILPIIILASTAVRRPGTVFWVTWTIFNVALAVVFGLLHQGGVVPSLFAFHSTLENATAGSSAHIIYWKTYIPPWHLLGMSRQDVLSGRLSFTDLAGAPRSELIAALSASSFNATYLAAPVPMFLALPESISSCMTLETSIHPHLDLDHLPESIQAKGYDGICLGIYVVEGHCVVDGQHRGAYVTAPLPFSCVDCT